MSKWLFEPQEWPKVTKQPLVTRVHGVKGDEPARQIAAQFEAPLAHFLQAQTQLRVNSGLDVYGSHQMLDGIKVNYTYQNGMEYLDIYVSQELAKQVETIEDFWDYALVELELPSIYTAQRSGRFICYAHLIVPREAALSDDSVWPADGVASNDQTRDTIDPVINAANSAATFTTISVTGDPGIASFTVDLRQSRGAVATLDIYAYLFGLTEEIPTTGVGWGLTTNLIYSGIGNPTVPDVKPPWPAGGPFSSAPTGVIVPALHFDRTAGQWVWDINSSPHYIQDAGYAGTSASTGLPVSGQPTTDTLAFGFNQITHSWYFWDLETAGSYFPAYSGPNPAPATLTITLFKGVPLFKALKDATFERWGDQNGQLFGPTVAVVANVPAYTTDTFPPIAQPSRLDNFYNIPKLGEVTIDTHRRIRTRPDIQTIASFQKA